MCVRRKRIFYVFWLGRVPTEFGVAKCEWRVECVRTGTASSVEEFVTIGDRVYFDLDKAEIRDGTSTLNDQAAWLKKYPNITIVVEGHADERGTREYNLALGERRANAVKEYLVSRGVSANRIETVSYGKERPAVLGSNNSAWAQNRRGVSVVRGGAS